MQLRVSLFSLPNHFEEYCAISYIVSSQNGRNRCCAKESFSMLKGRCQEILHMEFPFSQVLSSQLEMPAFSESLDDKERLHRVFVETCFIFDNPCVIFVIFLGYFMLHLNMFLCSFIVFFLFFMGCFFFFLLESHAINFI